MKEYIVAYAHNEILSNKMEQFLINPPTWMNLENTTKRSQIKKKKSTYNSIYVEFLSRQSQLLWVESRAVVVSEEVTVICL